METVLQQISANNVKKSKIEKTTSKYQTNNNQQSVVKTLLMFRKTGNIKISNKVTNTRLAKFLTTITDGCKELLKFYLNT